MGRLAGHQQFDVASVEVGLADSAALGPIELLVVGVDGQAIDVAKAAHNLFRTGAVEAGAVGDEQVSGTVPPITTSPNKVPDTFYDQRLPSGAGFSTATTRHGIPPCVFSASASLEIGMKSSSALRKRCGSDSLYLCVSKKTRASLAVPAIEGSVLGRAKEGVRNVIEGICAAIGCIGQTGRQIDAAASTVSSENVL